MDELYLKLVRLQKETVGATFIMGYSKRSGNHYIHFSSKSKRFEDNKIEEVIRMAIFWIEKERRKTDLSLEYTLFDE